MPFNNKVIYAINSCSLELYDGIVTKRIKIEDLYEIIKNKGNILKLDLEELTKSKITKMIKVVTREDILNEILYINDHKYSHLKEIKELVNLDDFKETVITDELRLEKIKIKYTNMILDLLLDSFYDYDSVKLISKLKECINNYENRINKKIMRKVNEFYVKRITV